MVCQNPQPVEKSPFGGQDLRPHLAAMRFGQRHYSHAQLQPRPPIGAMPGAQPSTLNPIAATRGILRLERNLTLDELAKPDGFYPAR